MRTKTLLFFFAVAAFVLTACENNSNEIMDEYSILSRSVSNGYYLDGKSELYTGQPETYTLKKAGSTSLDGVYVVNWNYSSDLYRVSSDNVSITLGRKVAVGNYTISASLSNGETISKQITAIESPVPSVAEKMYVRPVGISKNIQGPYDNIDNYRYVNGQYYGLVSGDELCLKCKIENTSSSSIYVKLGDFKFAYDYSSVQYAPKSVLDENLNPAPSSVNIAGNGSVTVVFYLGPEWINYVLPNKVTVFNPYYSNESVSSTGYGYLLIQN